MKKIKTFYKRKTKYTIYRKSGNSDFALVIAYYVKSNI